MIAGATAWCLAVTSLSVTPGSVDGHCPGTAAHDYASGGLSLGYGYSDMIVADIDWTFPDVCNSGVSHSVSVTRNGDANGWVQVGWRYYAWYTSPKAYCEVNPGPYGGSGSYSIFEYAITPGNHVYKFGFADDPGGWRCRVDGDVKVTYLLSYMGWDRGSWMPVQGENHAKHVQIGRTYPDKLAFSEMRYRAASSGNVGVLDLGGVNSPVFPFAVSEPNPGMMKVWTVDH